jgi:hypothetical protein
MPGFELEPIGRSAPDLQGVPAQMSQIFARAGAPEAAAMTAAHPPRVSALRPGRTGPRPMTLLAVTFAGLVGLGAGAFIIHGPSPAMPAPSPVAEKPPVHAAPQPQAAAVDAGPPLIIPQAPVETAEATVVHPASLPKTPKVALVKAAPRQEPPAVAQPASCEKNAVGTGCRRAVIQADRHLRDVYERAIRRGVPRTVLVDYRDRWANLRGSETDNPAHLIEDYGALAYDLGREAKDDQESAVRRRDPSGLRALADALLPWR